MGEGGVQLMVRVVACYPSSQPHLLGEVQTWEGVCNPSAGCRGRESGPWCSCLLGSQAKWGVVKLRHFCPNEVSVPKGKEGLWGAAFLKVSLVQRCRLLLQRKEPLWEQAGLRLGWTSHSLLLLQEAWKHAIEKAKHMPDPWAEFHLEDIATERATRHRSAA